MKESPIMRNDYKHHYSLIPAPSVRNMVAYADPVGTDEERRAKASRVAKQQAVLRRAKTGERWIVFTAAIMMATAMLPMVVVAVIITLVIALWRRGLQGRERQRASVPTARRRTSTDVSRRRGSGNPSGTTAKDPPHPAIGNACTA
jgi:RecA/RadA recombinase